MQEQIYTFRNIDEKNTDVEPTSTPSQSCSGNLQAKIIEGATEQSQQFNHQQQQQEQQQQQQQERHKSQHQIMLEFKIGQLQKICQTLTSANSRLLNRIDMLQTKLQQQQHQKEQNQDHKQDKEDRISQNSNHSGFKSQILELQNIVKQYRGNLQDGKIKFDQEMFKKQVENERLKQQNDRLRAHIVQLKKKNQELQKQLYAERANDTVRTSLLQHKGNDTYNPHHSNRIQINKKLSRERSFDSIGHRPDFQNSQIEENFNLTVFSQMERLVTKLTSQLQHQRRMKKKMKHQIDRLVEQMLKSEAEIKEKNNKIYHLQLESLKQRHTSYSTFMRRQSLKAQGTRQKQFSETQHMRSSGNKIKGMNLFHSYGQRQLQSYRETSIRFKDLISMEYQVDWSKKMFIAIKIIDLYDKKLAENNFGQISIQNIVIQNLNSIDTSKINVTQLSGSKQSNVIKTQQNLLFNLCAIIESLLNQVKQNTQNRHQYLTQKQQILQYLQYILDNKTQNMANSINILRKYFEQLYRKSYY